MRRVQCVEWIGRRCVEKCVCCPGGVVSPWICRHMDSQSVCPASAQCDGIMGRIWLRFGSVSVTGLSSSIMVRVTVECVDTGERSLARTGCVLYFHCGLVATTCASRRGGDTFDFLLSSPPPAPDLKWPPVLLIVNRPFFVNPPPPRSPERITRHLITVNHPHNSPTLRSALCLWRVRDPRPPLGAYKDSFWS